MIQSNYMGFGSGVVVPGTEISLHNRSSNFVVNKGHPNHLGPSKHSSYTIIPDFVSKDGLPVMSFEVMGGTIQPKGHAQGLVRIAEQGQNPQKACEKQDYSRYLSSRSVASKVFRRQHWMSSGGVDMIQWPRVAILCSAAVRRFGASNTVTEQPPTPAGVAKPQLSRFFPLFHRKNFSAIFFASSLKSNY